MNDSLFEELMWNAQEAIASRSRGKVEYERQKIHTELDAEEISQNEHDRLMAVLDSLCEGCGG